MYTRTLAAAAVLVMLSSPALAFYCPADAGAIDNALSKVSLSAAKMSEVKQLRDQGMSQHDSGQHTEAVSTLAQAMRIILNDM